MGRKCLQIVNPEGISLDSRGFHWNPMDYHGLRASPGYISNIFIKDLL
jgi:hypothetical protein